jgi:BNR repeat-containing family member
MIVNKLVSIVLILLSICSVNIYAQPRTIAGYRGIWFTLGQFSTYGDKYSGGLGTYTSSHIPVAVYSPQVNKTFFVYGGTTEAKEKHLLIMISFYDHKNRQVPQPVVVYDKQGVDDPHDNASLSIDEHGFIWVFVSGRNTSRPGLIFKSKKANNITAFDKVYTGEMTYPQPWWVEGKGFFHLFTKYTKGRELYWSTSRDGNKWSPDQKLAGMGGHYQVSNRWKNKIVTAFNYHPGGNVDQRTNIYLMQTTDMGRHWTNVMGKALQTPLSSKLNEAMVRDYESEGKLVYLNDINFDAEGNPVILAVISNQSKPGPPGNLRDWVIAKWSGKEWKFIRVCRSTHNYDMGSLYIHGRVWTVIGPTEQGPQANGTGGEMAMWRSTDNGATWIKQAQLTQNSNRNHSYARRPSVMNPGFTAFWADGNADSLSISHLYFSDEAGKVYQLPYDMRAAMEQPVLIQAK